MDKDTAVLLHGALLFEFRVGCQPNNDAKPTSMLYYMIRDDALSTFLFMIDSHDPIKIVPILEKKLLERFPEARKHDRKWCK